MKKILWLWFTLSIFLAHHDIQSTSISFPDIYVEKVPDSTAAHKFMDIADDLIMSGDYDSSLVYFEKAMVLFEEDKDWEKYIYCKIGTGKCCERIGDFDSSLKFYQEAKKITLERLDENHPHMIKILVGLGDTYATKGDYDIAKEYLRNAISMGELLDEDKSGGKNSSIPDAYHNLGFICFEEGKYDSALIYINKTVNLGRKMFGDSDLKVGSYYNSLAVVYTQRGDVDEAIKNYDKSKDIYFQNGHYIHPHIAIVYHNIALLLSEYYWDNDQALIYLEKALSIALEVVGENHFYTALIYSKIGLMYEYKKDYEEALKIYEKSISIFSSVYGTEEHVDVAKIYFRIGNVYKLKEDYDTSLVNYEKALSIQKKLFGEQHHDIGETYSQIGNVKASLKQYDEAIKYHKEALQIQKSTFGEWQHYVAACYNNLGRVYASQKNYDLALETYQLAINSNVPAFGDTDPGANPELEGIISDQVFLKSMSAKAEIFVKRYAINNNLEDIITAHNTYFLMLDLIDKIRRGAKVEGSKLNFAEETYEIYTSAIKNSISLFEITGESKYKEDAFTICEKNKASILLEAITESEARTFTGIPDSLLENERQLKVDIAFYETQIQNERLKLEKTDSLKITEYKDLLFSLNNKYISLIRNFEEDFTQYYNSKYRSSLIDIETVQNSLDNNTALLEYFVGEDVIYIYFISNDSFDVLPMYIDSSFSDIVDVFHRSIKKIEKKEYLSAANKLYQKLLDPVEDLLAGKQNLIIIPGGNLYNIPFEALITEPSDSKDFTNQSYLINRYAISYNYSSLLYLNTLELPTEEKPQFDFVGFAPVFDDSVEAGETIKNTIKMTKTAEQESYRFLKNKNEINELPYSEIEIEYIVELFEQEEKYAKGYFRKQAREENFKSVIKDYKIVHLATHSFINPEQSKFSGIILAQPEDSSNTEDGTIYSNEIYNLDLDADLVVLSSCESGIGKLVRGEGMMALMRGFIYSGTRNVLTSLWKVMDESTSKLMIDFYKYYIGGNPFPEALRNAKLNMINNKSTSFPLYWSGFVLIGR